jgi:hypothetical protein
MTESGAANSGVRPENRRSSDEAQLIMSRNLEHPAWQEYICDDLQPVLIWLREQHNIHITEIVFDMKGSYTYIYIDSPLTKELAEEAGERFSVNDELRIEEGWFGCPRDFSSIESSKRGDQDDLSEKSFVERLKNLFG